MTLKQFFEEKNCFQWNKLWKIKIDELLVPTCEGTEEIAKNAMETSETNWKNNIK